MRKRTSRLFVLGLTLAGCGDSSSSSLDVPEFQLEHVLTIGELDDPEYSFNRIATIAIDERGFLYVADAGDARIRVYSRQGRFVRDIGRQGQGPGEFAALGTIGVLAGTIYAIDLGADRISYFDTTGTLRGTVRATRGSHGTDSGVTVPFVVLPGGRELSNVLRPPSDPNRNATILLTRRGEVIDTLMNVESSGGLRFQKGGTSLFVRNPFARPNHFAVSPGGEYSVMIRVHPDGNLEPGEFEVRLDRIGAAVAWERLFRDEPIVYPGAKADSLIAAIVSLPPGLLTESELRSAAPPPKYEAPVQGAVIGVDGRLYIRRPGSGDSIEWLVVGPAGKVEGRIRLPATTGKMIARGDTITVVEPDEWGVPRVVEYRVRRRGR